MTTKHTMIHCKECGALKPHQGLGLCSFCYMRTYKPPTHIGECKHCHVHKKLRSKGLCGACYQYQLAHGTPREDSVLYTREEYDFMTRTMGLDHAAAVARIADGLGLKIETVKKHLRAPSKASA